MASKLISLRLDEELLAWADEYARARGVSRTDLLVSAVASFRVDCEAGVPELRRLASEQAALGHPGEERGVGDCPDRPGKLGHLWRMDEERVNRCRFCGMPGREFLERASAARAELVSRLPASAHGGKAGKGK